MVVLGLLRRCVAGLLVLGLGMPIGAGAASYLHGPGGVLAERTGSSVSWLLGDGLGSVRHVTDAAGGVTGSVGYGVFGERRSSTGVGSSFGFSGQQQDSGGDVFLRARTYRPSLGRFVSADPLQPNASTTQGWSLYGYVGANPTTFTDPSGFSIFSEYGLLSRVSSRLQFEVVRLGLSGGFSACLAHGVLGTGLEGGLSGDAGTALGSVAVEAGSCGLEKGAAGRTNTATPDDPNPTPNTTSSVPAIKPGSAGGPTAGRRFPESVRQGELAQNPSTCVYCRMETDAPQIDHAVPRSRGGNATPENAQTTCGHCNASKGNRDFPVTPPGGYEGPWPPPWWDE